MEMLLKKAQGQIAPISLRDTAVNYFLLTLGAVGLAIRRVAACCDGRVREQSKQLAVGRQALVNS